MKNPSMKAGAGVCLSAIQANPSTFCPPALTYREATAHIDAALDALRAFDAAERKRKEAMQ